VAAAYSPASGLGTGINVNVVQGANFSSSTAAGLAEAAAAAKAADIVVLAVGEAPESESEGNDNTLELSDSQRALFEAVAAAGKPIVTVLVEPRPRILGRVALGSDALVMSYLPCYNGGVAIGELLFGELNPSGRLALTYPQYSGDVTPYFRKPTGDYSQGTSQPFHSPLYTFGHGLSYSTIVEGAPVLSTDRLGANETLGVTVTVQNKGPVDAWHTVLLFVRQLWRTSITPEMRLLKAFQRVFVANGATVDVKLSVPYKALAYATPALETRVEAAGYEAIVGTGETLITPFNVTEGTSYGTSLRYT
jgi:beta-glucosidase